MKIPRSSTCLVWAAFGVLLTIVAAADFFWTSILSVRVLCVVGIALNIFVVTRWILLYRRLRAYEEWDRQRPRPYLW